MGFNSGFKGLIGFDSATQQVQRQASFANHFLLPSLYLIKIETSPFFRKYSTHVQSYYSPPVFTLKLASLQILRCHRLSTSPRNNEFQQQSLKKAQEVMNYE